MQFRACLVTVAMLGLVPTTGSAFPRLTVNFGYLDYQPSGCAAPGSAVRLHVVAEASYLGQVSGAQFRVTGIDSTWHVVVTPAPTVTMWIGDPLGDGLQVAVYPPCQYPNADLAVPLFTMDVVVPAPFGKRTIGIEQHAAVPVPNYACPFITACDEDFRKECVITLTALLIDCVVGVQPTTWSTVKDLYRE